MPFGKATPAYDRNLIVLQERYAGIEPTYHMNKSHWISVRFDRDVPDRTIEELVRQSYDLVAASLSAKERDALQTAERESEERLTEPNKRPLSDTRPKSNQCASENPQERSDENQKR